MSANRYYGQIFMTGKGTYTDADNWYSAKDYDSLRAQLEKVEAQCNSLVKERDERSDALRRLSRTPPLYVVPGYEDCSGGEILERIRHLESERDTAYQRGAREMRERALKACGSERLEDPQDDSDRGYENAITHCQDAIERLPTGPLDRTKV
jgi:hypothetical protein